jgi:N6-L-threonylcarbamoyladenine synthase
MKVLGFESSCDETGVALVQAEGVVCSSDMQRFGDESGGLPVPRLLADALHSQVAMHADYGGVVPELASRDHVRRVVPLARQVLVQAQCSVHDIDAIAYTRGPGLAGALLVGAGVAVALAAALGKPAIGVHHLEGHLLSPFLADHAPQFPFVALLVSGGHTQLMDVQGVGRYTLLGETIDDAAGEAFDKSAKLMGLGYPGGPALARLAERGDAKAFALPRPLLHSGDFDFSFAGLKTAVMMQYRKLGPTPSEQALADLAASAQAAIVDVLVAKTLGALKTAGVRRLVVGGGVGSNRQLRRQLDEAALRRGLQVYYPPLHLCTDNGAMIALAAALRLQRGLAALDRGGAFDVKARWPLDQIGLH